MYSRQFRRIPLQLALETPDSALGELALVNLSVNGAGLRGQLAHALSIGEWLDVRFSLPDGEGAMTARGEIVWVDGRDSTNAHIGVRFVDLTEPVRGRIECFIRRLLDQHKMENAPPLGGASIIGQSTPMFALHQLIARVAPFSMPVLSARRNRLG